MQTCQPAAHWHAPAARVHSQCELGGGRELRADAVARDRAVSLRCNRCTSRSVADCPCSCPCSSASSLPRRARTSSRAAAPSAKRSVRVAAAWGAGRVGKLR